MKLTRLSLIVLVAFVAGCSSEAAGKDYATLSGNAGKVSCAIQDDGGSRTVDTTIPDKMPLDFEGGSGTLAVVNCQKMKAPGKLTVDLVIDGKEVASQSTSAAHGISMVDSGGY